jgi:hypothetical protein
MPGGRAVRRWEKGEIRLRLRRAFGTVRRFVALSVAVLTVGLGLAAGAPAAHAGGFCGWTGGWAPITLVNGWTSEQSVYSTGDPSYCLEANGMVYLSGSIAATPGTASESISGDTFGTLPPAERPASEIFLDVYTKGGTYGVLRIQADGVMSAYAGSATGYTSLAGVSFPAAGVSQTGTMPLENGWKSAQGTYGTGDPSYFISNGIVNLSGSLERPAGTPADFSSAWAAATLPPSALPSDNCFGTDTYTYGGGIWEVGLNGSGALDGANARYTSLAGISYPQAPTAWQPLTLLNGSSGPDLCNTGPSYFVSGNVVYLTGVTFVPTGFTGEIAVLPPAARPTHYVYMIAANAGSGSAPADVYDTLMIGPGGDVWIVSPPGGAAAMVTLAGLSFHTGS